MSRVGPHSPFHLMGGGFSEESEVVKHEQLQLQGEGHLADEVLTGIAGEDLLDELGDLLIGPEPALLRLLLHLVKREAPGTVGVAITGHDHPLLELVELVAGGGGVQGGIL